VEPRARQRNRLERPLAAPAHPPAKSQSSDCTTQNRSRAKSRPTASVRSPSPLRANKVVQVDSRENSPVYCDKATQTPALHNQNILAWVDEFVVNPPEQAQESQVLDDVQRPVHYSGEDSEVMPGLRLVTATADTTASPIIAQGQGKGQRNPPNLSKLRLRRVELKSKADKSFGDILKRFRFEVAPLSMKAAKGFEELCQQFLTSLSEKRQGSSGAGTVVRNSEDLWLAVEGHSRAWDNLREVQGSPIVLNEYFRFFCEMCQEESANEALVQRFLMANVLHPYWYSSITQSGFRWTKTAFLVPPRREDVLARPQPDLAISFSLEAISDGDAGKPSPPDLESCIWPDGGSRCFPFLFMEVKKNDTSLLDAEYQNLSSASQALYNIYQWVLRIDCDNEDFKEIYAQFFKEVRVFSLAFNAKTLAVRVHRAYEFDGDHIGYGFEEFKTLPTYDRDQLCSLTRSIVEEYAAKELFEFLKKVFLLVSTQVETAYNAKLALKRKARVAGSNTSKRACLSVTD